MKTLIQNSKYIATMNDKMEEWNGGHILIENDKIISIGKNNLKGDFDQIIDASEMVVLPGFINTHHHLFQSLTRNIPKMQNQELFDWLINHYEIWREIDEDAVAVSTQVGLLEMMLSGVSTSSDHLYLFPQKCGKNLIDIEVDAAQKLGIRFQPTRGSMSLSKKDGGLPPDDVVQTEAEILQDSKRLIEKYHNQKNGAMTRISLAPCSPFSVTAQLMKQTAELAKKENLMIHTHLAETIDEENFCIEKFGDRPAKYLENLNWIGGNVWVAHAVHLSDEEIAKMGKCGMGISHCPSSNMRLGSGIARIKEMLQAGVAVSLGVDGSASNDSSNMLSEIRQAMLLSRLRKPEFWLTAREVLRIATRGGAMALGRDDIGSLEVGKQADIAMFSLNQLEYAGALSDPLAALVFTQRMRPVDYLMVNGKVQIENGKSKINLENLIIKQNEISKNLIIKAQQNTGVNFLKFDKIIL
ncbi:MAG: 8-oxoguanine deaminase [Candidatus Cloacimonetes bacterium]|jgi:8-oxoguanine deaminase|nr:8-oxoguanine deaminase [Candidatus Cloacimonadota bacterium]MBT6993537.1 8-oxoguanine deaminase [Candidatus Cloacimonadota bacterium]